MAAVAVSNPAYAELSVEALDPHPENRPVTDVESLAGSIKESGVLEPLLVTPTGDRYRIVCGERRWRAAILAERDTVPCIVRPDMSEVDQLEAMLVENLQREQLTLLQEARQHFRLIGLRDSSVKDFAARIGKSPQHVAARLALLEMPEAVQKKVDTGKLPLSTVTALRRLRHDPEAMREAVKAVLQGDDASRAVNRVKARQEHQRERAAVVTRLLDEGVTFIEHTNSYSLPRDCKRLRDLSLDERQHGFESCHAVVISGDNATVLVCTDPSRHASKGASRLKTPPPTKREKSAHEIEQQERQKRMKEVRDARRDFIAKLLTERPRRADVIPLVCTQFFEAARAEVAKLACGFLGIEAPSARDDVYGSKALDLLRERAAEGDRQQIAVALAVALAYGESHVGEFGWSSPEVSAHMTFLQGQGYLLTDVEQDRIAAAESLANRHERAVDNEADDDGEPNDDAADGEPDDEDDELDEEAA